VFYLGDAEKILTASIAAKNAMSAKKSFIMVFNLRIFASFAAENYYFFCNNTSIQSNSYQG
jgi:hypothetical protein